MLFWKRESPFLSGNKKSIKSEWIMNYYPFKYDTKLDASQLLTSAAARCGEKVALIDGANRFTYAQMEGRVNQMANLLLRMTGGRSGAHVGLISTNSAEYLMLNLACARARMISVHINWRCSPREMSYLLRSTHCEIVFYKIDRVDWRSQVLEEFGTKLTMIDLAIEEKSGTSPFQRLYFQEDARPVRVEGSIDEVMTFYNTSGSSGIPKTAVYTHRIFLDKISCTIKAQGFVADMVFQTMTQLFHAGSLGGYMCLSCGGTLVLLSHFNETDYLECIARERVTRITVAPNVLQRLLDDPQFKQFDLSSLQTINCSMAPMPVALLERIHIQMPYVRLMQIYGMTEMCGAVTVLLPQQHFSKNDPRRFSVGKVIEDCRLRIETPEGAVCAPGQIGEIVIQGVGLMKGYYNNPQKTAYAMRRGWYHSQDLGYLDEEGFLFLKGRSHEMIITGGENVYPKEVEDIFYEHPAVDQLCVFGVPSILWGEAVVACVVLKEGYFVTEAELRHFARQYMAGYKVPKRIWLVPKLPVNPVGKVLRRLLVERYSPVYQAEDETISAQDKKK